MWVGRGNLKSLRMRLLVEAPEPCRINRLVVLLAVALCLVREGKRLVVVVIVSNVGNLGEVFQTTVVNSQGDYQAEEFSKANVGGC